MSLPTYITLNGACRNVYLQYNFYLSLKNENDILLFVERLLIPAVKKNNAIKLYIYKNTETEVSFFRFET